MRKKTVAKKIETELNERNAKLGKTEKVEVDVDSVDWLYRTYKIKGDDTIYQEGDRDASENDATDLNKKEMPIEDAGEQVI